ncbi:g7689 [Coccomyxa elongata]
MSNQIYKDARVRQKPLSCSAAQLATSTEASPSAVAQNDGLIFGLGSEGAWDEAVVGSPVVRCFMGEEGSRWLMWYSGRSAGDPGLDAVAAAAGSIGVAASSNGMDWERGHSDIEGARGAAKERDVGRVLAPNEEDWWWLDTRHMTVSDVQVLSSDGSASGGVYWMFYSGSSFETAAAPAGLPGLEAGTEHEGLRGRAGLSLSQDGKNWARFEATHHTAAILDAGDEGDWDEAFVGSPQVVAVGPRDMRMFYHTFCAATQKWTIGWASSENGFAWRKQGQLFSGSDDEGAFDGGGAAACHVVRDFATKRWVMFYEGVARDNGRSIGMAVSADGRDWRRLPRPVLEAGPPGAWDSGGVGAPCAVPMAEGRWRMYYHGLREKGGCACGIGVALTDKESSEEFEGIRVAFCKRPQP